MAPQATIGPEHLSADLTAAAPRSTSRRAAVAARRKPGVGRNEIERDLIREMSGVTGATSPKRPERSARAPGSGLKLRRLGLEGLGDY
jgi:hypothetical protein